MAIIFSPLANEEMTGAFKPMPGCAFVMMHSAKAIAPVEREIEKRAIAVLQTCGFATTKATGSFGTKDFLDKIIRLIRGCGFGLAIFSEFTPAKTLANIFFEIGICYVLGKDVILIKTKDAPIPSDFVRNEWIEFEPADKSGFSRSLQGACNELRQNADFYRQLGEIALEAADTDYELAFERFKQSALLVHSATALDQIKGISVRLAALSGTSADAKSYFKRPKGEIDRFLKLQPLPRSR